MPEHPQRRFSFCWAPYEAGEKMEITFFPDRGLNPVHWTQSPTLYRVAIKASLYRKAVQVCYIPITGDTKATHIFSAKILVYMPYLMIIVLKIR